MEQTPRTLLREQAQNLPVPYPIRAFAIDQVERIVNASERTLAPLAFAQEMERTSAIMARYETSHGTPPDTQTPPPNAPLD